MKKKFATVCRHCHRPCNWPCRGLCKRCYTSTGVRDLYRKLPNNKAISGACLDDHTEAEIEALIDIQRPTMPEQEQDREPVCYVGVYIPRAVLSGRGMRSRSLDL